MDRRRLMPTRKGRPPAAETLRKTEERLRALFQNTTTDQLSVNLIIDRLLSMRAAGAAPRTINQAVAFVSKFSAFLAGESSIQFTPADRDLLKEQLRDLVVTPKPFTTRRFFLPEERSQLFETIAGHGSDIRAARNVALWGSVLFGFCRLGELLKLPTNSVLHNPELFQFSLYLPGEITKTGQPQTVEIFRDESRIGSVSIYEHLLRYHTWRIAQGSTETDLYFVRLRGEGSGRLAETTARRQFKYFAGRANLPKWATTHRLRNTAGEEGGNIFHGDSPTMQQLFGHSSAKTTEIYTNNHNTERLSAARRKLARQIAGYSEP